MTIQQQDDELTHDLQELLTSMGADLFGVAAADDFEETEPHKRPLSVMPEAKTIAVFTCRIPFGSATPHATPSYLQAGYYGLEAFINKLSHRGSLLLEDRGFLAAGSPAGRDIVRLTVRRRGEDPDIELHSTFDLRLAAVKAGIGQIGMNNNLITDEYGSRLRIGAILTNAPLRLSSPKEYGVVPDFCTACGYRCVKSCPAKALSMDGGVDHYRCMVISPEKVDPVKAIYTIEKRYSGSENELASKMMGFTQNAPHACARCITLCPMDKSRQDRAALLRQTEEGAKS